MEDFYAQCDPDKENLCLYGNPDGSWEVQLPAEEVPPELPEPALGINFARDGMQVRECETHLSLFTRAATEGIPDSDPPHPTPRRTQRKDWLALVAVHSDAWLMAVAFYYGAKFDGKERCVPRRHSPVSANYFLTPSGSPLKTTLIFPLTVLPSARLERREKLFKRINSLPTVYEILSGKASAKAKGNKKAPASVAEVRHSLGSISSACFPHPRFSVPKTPRFPATAQPPAKKQALGGAAAMDPAGIKKPSPGFLLKAEGSLTPLNNAHIEVRRDPSSPTSPGRFPLSHPSREFFLRAFPRETGRAAAVASHATRRLSGGFRFFSRFQTRVRFALPVALSLSSRLRLDPLPFSRSCTGPTTACGTRRRWCP